MLTQILSELQAYGAKLIAISKTHSEEAILQLYRQGQHIFGENKVQELVPKYEALPKDIEWHIVGHLQTNKVKYIAPFIACIHSVDSMKILKEIDKQAKRNHRNIDCLLQFHIAEEETKFGLSLEEAVALLQSPEFQLLKNARIAGVMGMATFTEDMTLVHKEFRHLKDIFTALKNRFFAEDDRFREISMGMSGDYKVALEEGSTMVRIGTLLFGHRE